jgi:hypothetical protein
VFLLASDVLEAGPEALTVAVVEGPANVNPFILAIFVQVSSYLRVKFVENCFLKWVSRLDVSSVDFPFFVNFI